MAVDFLPSAFENIETMIGLAVLQEMLLPKTAESMHLRIGG
jgi:hypothetical protein